MQGIIETGPRAGDDDHQNSGVRYRYDAEDRMVERSTSDNGGWPEYEFFAYDGPNPVLHISSGVRKLAESSPDLVNWVPGGTRMIRCCYPDSWTAVRRWANANGVSAEAATVRYIQVAALDSVASDPLLAEIMILRGGSALRLFYGGLRETRDLDLLVLNLPGLPIDPSDIEYVKNRMNAVLNDRLPEYFNGEERWDQWLATIKLDLARCKTVCECTPVNLRPSDPQRRIKVHTGGHPRREAPGDFGEIAEEPRPGPVRHRNNAGRPPTDRSVGRGGTGHPKGSPAQ